MWHIITPVQSGYDPIVSEGDQPLTVVLLNAGPDTVTLRAWATPQAFSGAPDVKFELRAGSQRIVSASLVRVQLNYGGGFAAIGARVVGPDGSSS